MSFFTKTVGLDVRCGEEFALPKLKGKGVTLYNATGSTMSKGKPFLWEVASTTVNKEEQAIAPVTSTTIHRIVVVAMEDIPTLKIGKFQFSGLAECLVVETGNIAADNHLEVLNAGVSFIDNGSSLTVNSVGMLKDAVVSGENSGSPVLKTVYLRGERIHIAAT